MNIRGILYFTVVIVFSGVLTANAQPSSLPAEAQKAYQSAGNALNNGDYANAIMMYAQAIRLAPDNVMLRRDLAYTYFLSGNKQKAQEIIEPVVNSDVADEQTFQVASAIEASLGNNSKASRLISAGLKKFPQSGILYNAKGNLAMGEKKGEKNAIEAWQNGIDTDPAYYGNYYNAAKYYYTNGAPVWAALYAEVYVNLDQNSPRTIEMKKLITEAYQKLFSPENSGGLPEFSAGKQSEKNSVPKSFADAYKKIMMRNSVVISDGFLVEGLIMLRTRFILDWNRIYVDRYFYTLFSYHDKLLRTGNFDAYNQWLFGANDNSQQFGIWLKTNQETYTHFEQWQKNNPYMPAVSDPKP